MFIKKFILKESEKKVLIFLKICLISIYIHIGLILPIRSTSFGEDLMDLSHTDN